MIDLEIIAVTYKQQHERRCFLESLICQTNANWKLHLIHDGPDGDFVRDQIDYDWENRILWYHSPNRFNDWGHTLRATGIGYLGDSKYTLITNADNYYMPTFIEEMANHDLDAVICDFVHSHQGYKHYFSTDIKISQIDCGAIIVRTDIVKKVGWNYRNFAADWEFIREVFELNPTWGKVEKTLFVHN